jgi:hypothetical protein
VIVLTFPVFGSRILYSRAELRASLKAGSRVAVAVSSVVAGSMSLVVGGGGGSSIGAAATGGAFVVESPRSTSHAAPIPRRTSATSATKTRAGEEPAPATAEEGRRLMVCFGARSAAVTRA